MTKNYLKSVQNMVKAFNAILDNYLDKFNDNMGSEEQGERFQ